MPLSRLPLLSEAERRQLADWNRTAAGFPAEACLHELIAAQAARTPGAPAVRFAGRTICYAELEEASNRLARRLRRFQVGQEVRVGVCAERSLEMVVALVAVLKAGGAYVPLDPGYPAERLAYMLEDSGVGVLLTQGHLVPALPAHGPLKGAPDQNARVVLLDELWTLDEPASPLATEATPESLAYMIYTSGSTGRPKGAMNAHRGIVNRLAWMQAEYGLGPDDRVLQKTPFSFDVSVWEFFWPLITGACLVVAKPGGHQDANYLVQTIAAEGITTLHFVPSMLQVFVEAPGLEACTSLRRVLASGEALPFDLVERWYQRMPAPLHNLYGPTEAAVDVTYWPCAAGDARRLVPIGRPVWNTRIHLLDRWGAAAALGVAGELYIGGVQVGRGYLGRPELTAERFVPDFLGNEAGARLYRTGDLARRLPSGEVEYLGRVDFQVKVRGFRIELGEIEAALAAQPGVREAVVLARVEAGGTIGGMGGARLVSYLVPEAEVADRDAFVLGVRTAVATRLPEYMVPQAFVVLDELPLSPNGKVDRRALAAVEAVPSTVAVGEMVAPRTPLETFLAGLWSEALGIEQVGVHDHFFQAGGNSIIGAILINRLQERLREIVHVVAIFDHPTVAGLAAYLQREHAPAVARVWGGPAAAAAETAGWVDEARVLEIRELIPPLAPLAPNTPLARKNPPAVFLLSPPRSGSTLLRVMLAGNPALFAPPELELLGFATLGERRAAFSGRDSFWLEGLIRAVMELLAVGPEEAKAWLAEAEDADLPVPELYRRLQARLQGADGVRRLLVDKTPSYALNPSVLERAEELFEGARYIHLLRHPHGMIHSFEEAKLEQVFFRYPHAFGRRELAELVWLVSQRNVERFFAERVGEERRHRVRFEELVREPERVLRGICEFLEVEYHPDMADPYQERSARMTDGVYEASRMLGDVKFHDHRGVDAAAADRWRADLAEDFLGVPTRAQAVALGYDDVAGSGWAIVPEPALPGAPVALSFAQERLWFLDQLTPESSAYNIPLALRLLGDLDHGALARSLSEILCRHSALRARFTAVEGRPVQEIVPAAGLALPVVDLSGLPAERRDGLAGRLALAEIQRPFDLARPPLMRALVLRLAPQAHAVVVTQHHIASDGWSLGVFVREVAALYAAFAGDGARRRSPLPEPPIQYADFARWQRAWLQGEVLARQLAYWRGALAGLPPLALPTDRPRPAVLSSRGGHRPFRLPAALAASLAALGERERATPFMTLLAGFQALLGRLTGQDDVAVGTPVANRTRPEIEGLIGFFSNTLVLRGDLAGDPTVAELMARTRTAVRGAFGHQDLPFEKVVGELAPERDLSRSPLFQAMFALQNARPEAAELPGLTLARFELEAGSSKFDLLLAMTEQEGGLAGTLEYSRDLFDAATADRLVRHLGVLLAALGAADGGARIAELPLLAAAEQHQLLAEWGPVPGPPAPGTLHGRFEEQAARTPEAVALISASAASAGGMTSADSAPELERLTYRELDQRAGRLARRLRALGVGPERTVAVCLGRTAALPIALLAVLKAGGAYVPLDPAYPRERLAFMLADSGARVLLTEAARLELFAAPPAQVLLLDQPSGEDDSVGAAVWPEPAARNLAYLIYTSGSTGRPKGVAVTHGSAAALVDWARRSFAPADLAAVFAATSVCFDLSVFELFVPLATGGRIVLGDDALALAGHPASAEVTLLNTVPSAAAELERAGALPASLRVVNLAGEALRGALVERLHAALPEVRAYNLYGPSEDTTYSTGCLVPRGDGREPSIGRPLDGTRAAVVDRRLQPVPIGVPGELLLGGDGLARGYFGRPDLTAEKFVPDPFAAIPGARLYRTGDLVRYRTAGGLRGELEFLGRIDHQVKVRGFRIELGEVETALGEHPAVREAVALARRFAEQEGGGEDTRLVGYAVVRPGVDPPSVSDLRAFLQQRLPEAMVPSAFVLLPALPRNANGKVDRGALPAPDAARPELGRAFAAPRNPIEEKLAEIWSQLLRVERVGIHDSFFDLGGHSLLATQALARVRDALGVEVSLRSLFGEPTIARLAAVIEQAAPRLALAPLPPPPPPPPSPMAPDAAAAAPAPAPAAGPAGPTRIQRVQRGRKPSDLLTQLDGLSDEEVRKLLQQKRGTPRDPGTS